ncbi:uncharacterized protein [Epargyreus clarus]|uniref:uncharacterized protein n=1 Tax=Epargyreus clarus TaxID=520877 RepID=UPI003C304E63
MADREKELIKKRASFKGRLTIFTNYIDSLSGKTLNDQDAAELQLRIGKMESLYDHYDEIQLALECVMENIEGQYSERSDFESIYYKSLAKAQNLLIKYNSVDKSTSSERGSNTNNHKLVKLPTINLPKFSGSYHNYLEFRDSFVSLIHSNEDIDDINKFHYLRACLEGAAAVVIQSIEFSAGNYAVAWKLLCDRYDNKRLLVQNHVSALFQIESVTKESSVSLKYLIDAVNKNLRALESLGEPVDHWDTLLIYIITHKLDQKSYREWEEVKGRLDKDSIITFNTFMQFMRNHADLIETLEVSRNKEFSMATKSSPKIKSMISVRNSSTETPPKTCVKCNGDHRLSNCPQFLALSNDARLKLLPIYKVCFNCFQSGHFANHCKKPGCKVCKRKHNTLIHVSARRSIGNSQNVSSYECEKISTPLSSTDDNTNNVSLSAKVAPSYIAKQSEVLLSTALIKLHDNNNCEHIVRAVLDSGSTSCLITERLCKQLKLVTKEIDRSILGINNVVSHVGETCRVNIKSLDNSFCSDINCFVLPLITHNVPGHEINLSNLNIPSNICLADPTFYTPGEVDVLIGADLFWDLLGSQKIKLGHGSPILCQTSLGWIISGPVTSSHISQTPSYIRCNFTKAVVSSGTNGIDDIRSDLTRFWQLEEINCNSSLYSSEEKLCEQHFVDNTSRRDDGRFCVRIPIKQDPVVLGDSFQRASQCLSSLERRLKSKPDLSRMYYDFMAEYKSLGHMSVLRQNGIEKTREHKAYYIPHHGVLRENSTTTKLRVVYNASSPSTSGISSNDIQMVGPTIQDDLLSILLRFRQHKYILSADVEKMYRQVVVHPSDRYLQQILWRDNLNEPVKIYQLNTVTYGTASAAFLATRCLRQIGLECTNNKIGEIIIHDFYVDDLLTGSDDLVELNFLRKEITDALASAGMHLRKWKSNATCFESEVAQTSLNLNIGSQQPSKLLGLSWHANSDELCFPISDVIPNSNTKRNLLSSISQIFDPLGLLAPCVIKMKILLQKLWLDKLMWDEPLSPEIVKRWHHIIKTLPHLNDLRIPRLVVCDSYHTIDLHIFSDASENAYGACVYVLSTNNEGVMVRLLMAKSRVAPIKPTTIPRLELCGVLVAARLYEKVLNSLRLKINQVYFWTDSTIVLGWLQMLPSRLQPFVRNRVAEILERAGNCTWRHVPTDQNPADLISRGVDIGSLLNLDLWWSGPEFLKQSQSQWPVQPTRKDKLPEIKLEVSFNVVDIDNLLLATIRESYWPIGGRKLAKATYHKCVKCNRMSAYSPNFGGLWEAGVKSTKFHLRRVLGHCNLTYEELYTVLTQIESILNSRPLSPLSSDPADCTPLTPGHFLIGRPLTTLPQPSYKEQSTSRLTRYQRIEQLRQHFWTRWSKEYVSELQQRVKWRSCKNGLKLNSLVVVKEDGLPPLKWKLGRVVAVHPGADGIIRVADIKTASGIIRRSFNRICPLPVTCSG